MKKKSPQNLKYEGVAFWNINFTANYINIFFSTLNKKEEKLTYLLKKKKSFKIAFWAMNFLVEA